MGERKVVDYNKSYSSYFTTSRFYKNSNSQSSPVLKPATKYNIVIIGKSGVGKSTLINYLFGEIKREVGTGKPVTEVGFHPVDFMLKKLPVRLFDSWGLEADKSLMWMEKLEKELSSRGVDKDITQWFHGVFYCIGAGGGRVEDFELKIIKRFLHEKYNVVVLLTKADQARKEQLDSITTLFKSEFNNSIVVIPVCSEEKVLLGGRKTQKFGKIEIEKQIPNSFWLSLIQRLPTRCINLIETEIMAWRNGMTKYINDNTGLFNQKNIYKHIEEDGKKFSEELQNNIVQEIIIYEVSLILEMYNLFRKGFNLPQINFCNNVNLSRTNIPYFDYNSDLVSSILASIIIPIGIFFMKGINKDNLNKILSSYTENLSAAVRKLEPEIQKMLVELSS